MSILERKPSTHSSMDSLRVSSVILISLMPVDQGIKGVAAWVQFPALLLI